MSRQEEAKQYNRIKIRLKFVDIVFAVLYLVLFQALVSYPLKAFTSSFAANFYYTFTLYLIGFCLIHYIINFPLHLYTTFILEHKFDLSNQSFFDWFKDDVKKGILSLVLFLIFIYVLYALLRNLDTTWWAWMAVFWFLVTVVLAKITPNLIIPLFFKYSHVKEDLKNEIIRLSKKCNIKILNIYEIDFSKKTKKLNAAVVGLGKTRRVLLADNLIREFNNEEVVGVLAHEFGHHKLRHMWKLLAFGIVSIFFSFYMLYLVSSKLVGLLNAEAVYDIKIFPAFMLVLFLAGLLTMPLVNGFSRKLERDADIFTLNVTQDKNVFISLMNKLADKNLADPNPPKLVKFLFYDHPPISERLKLAENFK